MPTTSKRREAVLDIPLELDRSRGNQALQVHAALRAAILEGRLAAGLRLPSTRALARQFRVKRNAVVIAYEHLQSDGLAEARIGSGTFVALLPAPARRPEPAKSVPETVRPLPAGPFALGKTYADPQLLRRLAAVTRRRIMRADDIEFGYGDPRGNKALREQVARYLATSRGFVCDPDCVFVISGTQQGLRLCAEALLSPGDTVWMEEPGYPVSRRTLALAGMTIVPVPVDSEGLDMGAGLATAAVARAAYVTPSHQFPTGVTMTMARRTALVEWARASGAWLLEDDYDSEFRYAGPPLTALAGIGGGDRVIYFGTFSKILGAGLRLAYMVVPPAAVDAVIAARAGHDRFPPGIIAGAVAELMASGFLADHIRRMRRRYRAARDVVVSALEASAGGALSVVKPEQGLHLLALLPAGLPPDAAAVIRERAGVQAWLLSETCVGKPEAEGFVLGFSGHEVAELDAAAVKLGEAGRSYLG
ncbi:PLP-dependent aminotransferase family protein [Mesorhizobium sp.]|uniref:MocR-like pyridoxine biosynthesis transcription factor PdxR n=1 Tax=Mesorhizobium sp. TaxID=1871066 RepID=UPI0025CCAC0C|nr:PLP-dependent aminotransferase family protein [Mesorhizobium sp.]